MKFSALKSKDFYLKESKNFCMMPWIHMHFLPSGHMFPCCIADTDYPFGKFPDNSIDELWNTESMKMLRLNMLQDKKTEACKRCYKLEEFGINTLRQSTNLSYEKNFDDVLQTFNDGSVENNRLRYFDVRFSNLCNLRCRTCGPSYSSSWDAELIKWNHSKVPLQVKAIPNTNEFFSQIGFYLKDVEKAYFAGGEPILTPEVYRVLDQFIEMGKTDVELIFTTNFSHLSGQSKSILDYWQKFSNVRVCASLDAMGDRAEILRKGTDWKKVVENRKKLIQANIPLLFEITPTISAINVHHFPDFHLDWVQQNLISADEIRINILTKPQFMDFSVIHKEKRNQIISKWEKAIQHFKIHFPLAQEKIEKIEEEYMAVISSLKNTPHDWNHVAQFMHHVLQLDEIRKEKLFSVFVELEDLIFSGNKEAKMFLTNRTFVENGLVEKKDFNKLFS